MHKDERWRRSWGVWLSSQPKVLLSYAVRLPSSCLHWSMQLSPAQQGLPRRRGHDLAMPFKTQQYVRTGSSNQVQLNGSIWSQICKHHTFGTTYLSIIWPVWSHSVGSQGQSCTQNPGFLPAQLLTHLPQQGRLPEQLIISIICIIFPSYE